MKAIGATLDTPHNSIFTTVHGRSSTMLKDTAFIYFFDKCIYNLHRNLISHLPFGFSIAPKSIIYEVTRRCNLKCKMCGNSRTTPHDNELSLPEIRTMVDNIAEVYAILRRRPKITITGGEPFIIEDLINIAHYIKDKGFKFSINTNGTLIDEGKAKNLASLGKLDMTFSLDCPEKINDQIRGVDGAYRRTLNSIELINKYNISKHISLTINSVI